MQLERKNFYGCVIINSNQSLLHIMWKAVKKIPPGCCNNTIKYNLLLKLKKYLEIETSIGHNELGIYCEPIMPQFFNSLLFPPAQKKMMTTMMMNQ